MQSNSFSTSPWTDFSGASGQAGYDGTNNAWRYDSSSSALRLQQVGLSFSGVHTYSIYAKYVDAQWFALQITGSTNESAWFDIQNGTLGSTSSAVDSSITSVGGGWYRCSVTGSASNQNRVRLYVVGSDGSLANITASLLIQDAQLEQGLVARDYIETTTTAVEGGITDNVPRLDYQGSCPALLLEPQRTNVFAQSEYLGAWTITALSSRAISSTSSPEGYNNAYELIEDNTNSYHRIYENFSYTSGSTYSFSVFAKSGNGSRRLGLLFGCGFGEDEVVFDLTTGEITQEANGGSGAIVDMGDGWYRCTMTASATNNGSSCAQIQLRDGNLQGYLGDNSSSILVYGATLEIGSYATSYIPTYGSAVTRGFDYSIVESLGYSSNFTFYYEFNTTTGREGSSPFTEAGKNQSNKIWIKGSSANNPQFAVQGLGIFSGSVAPTNEVSGINKIAVQWSSGVGVVFCNGVKQSGTLTNSDTSQTIDFITIKGNGTSHDSKQMLFFEEALSDAECIALTTL